MNFTVTRGYLGALALVVTAGYAISEPSHLFADDFAIPTSTSAVLSGSSDTRKRTYEMVVGWTGPINIRLLSQGDTPAGSLSGMTIALVLRDHLGNTLDTSGDVAITDTSAWLVRYTPDPDDMVPGVYNGRFKVTDDSGAIVYFPSGEWDRWIVRAEA